MKPLLSLLLAPLLALVLWLSLPTPAQALVHAHNDENGTPVVRSLESLRDLDYQSWQVVAYREGPPGRPPEAAHRRLSRQGAPRPPHLPAGAQRPLPLGAGRCDPGQSAAGG